MKSTEGEAIIQKLGLNKEFSDLDDTKTDEASKRFLKIAEKLFAEYQIAKGDIRFDFEEIEFYLYTEKHKDNNHVYPRVCEAGEWFVHYSGVDLTFQTYVEGENRVTQCGGILIRRIRKVGGESVGGPLRCLMEIFNGQESPKLVKKELHEAATLEPSTRIGIKNGGVQDNRLYRFVVENKNPQIKTTCPQYTKDDIVIKPKKYTYAPKNEE